MLEKDGFVSCLPLKLIQMRRSVLNRMVQEGNWDIVGRGRDHHPLASDDQELLSAIAQLESTANSTQHRKRHVTSVTSTGILIEAQGSRRKLLSVKTYEVNESVSSRKRLGRHSSDDSKVKVKKDAKHAKKENERNLQGVETTCNYTVLQSTVPFKLNTPSLNKKSDSNDSSLNDSSANVMPVRKMKPTANEPVSSPSTQSRTSYLDRTCVSTDRQNCSGNPTSDKHLSQKCCSSISDDVQAPNTLTLKLSKQDEIRSLNKQQGFAEPAMIPFISDSDDFVYVLVRRKAYLEWNTKQAGFRAAQHKNKCSTQQNIDRELSQLVTF